MNNILNNSAIMEFQLKNGQYMQVGEVLSKFSLSKMLDNLRSKEKLIFNLQYEPDTEIYQLEKIGYQSRLKFLGIEPKTDNSEQ